MVKPREGLKVLIVENDAAYRGAIIEALRVHVDPDVEIIVSKSVGDALIKLYLTSFDVVIMDDDVRSRVDGMNLWEKSRANFQMPPTILMSGADSESPGDGTALLLKPFRIKELKAAIAAICCLFDGAEGATPPPWTNKD